MASAMIVAVSTARESCDEMTVCTGYRRASSGAAARAWALPFSFKGMSEAPCSLR